MAIMNMANIHSARERVQQSAGELKQRASVLADSAAELGGSGLVKAAAIGDLGFDKVMAIGDAGLDKLNDLLDGFNQAARLLEEFGFRVVKFKIGSGLVPEIRTSIIGSLDRVNPDVIAALMEANKRKKVVTIILKAVTVAHKVQRIVNVLPYTNVRIDIVLGWPPEVSIDFVGDEPDEGWKAYLERVDRQQMQLPGL